MILLTLPLPTDLPASALGAPVSHRPDLACAGESAWTEALHRCRPDAVVTAAVPPAASLHTWRTACRRAVLLVTDGGVADGRHPGIRIVPVPAGASNETAEGIAALLGAAERALADLSDHPDDVVSADRSGSRKAVGEARGGGGGGGGSLPRGKHVLLVGAGVVNLVTAVVLTRAGYTVEIVEAGPDPRIARPWTEYGCTSGGANARMFTLTEGDNYHERHPVVPGPRNALFDRTIADGGWRIRPDAVLTAEEERWLVDHRTVPYWLARTFERDALDTNRAGGDGWERLRAREPDVFVGVGLRDGILRVYQDPTHAEQQIARQSAVGALRRVLTPAQVAEEQPGLADAYAAGLLGGAMEVVGFTVGVHDLVARVLDVLQGEGAVLLHWNERATRVTRGSTGVTGIRTASGDRRADHYVLSPGAYGGDLLADTRSAGQVHGVLGVWVTLPDVDAGLSRSLKIARRGHLAEDANVTLGADRSGTPTLTIGSGYGWTGADPAAVDPVQLAVLNRAVDDTARRYFPRAYATAEASGELAAGRRRCVRPWTTSGLGLFERERAAGGGVLVITGGHNTGGFAQAPAVAAAVLAALQGRRHPLHALCRPDRLRRVLDQRSDRESPAEPGR